MTHVSPKNAGKNCDGPSILGIWRVGRTLHQGDGAVVALAQPADAASNPRWDYVIKRAVGGDRNVEVRRQIGQYISAASAVGHPNLIAVLDASMTAGTPYVVMPRLDGHTMQDHIDSTKLKPLPVALWFVRQAAQALEALHTGGWVHGDVKPQNAIVGPRGHVTLIDLGFASRVHTASHHIYRGTPNYSAPETLSGEMASMPSMDIFSLGRVLWQWMIRCENVNTALMEPVAELVEAMVSDDPSARPSAGTVAKGLLLLEIETLGRHIGPGAQRRAA